MFDHVGVIAPGLAERLGLRPASALPTKKQPEPPPDVMAPVGHKLAVRLLPVLPQLASLFVSGGLRAGTAIAITHVSVLLAAIAGATSEGLWCAVVGVPELGVMAAGDVGARLDRLALVPAPGEHWAEVTASLLEGFPVVAVAPPGVVPPMMARRLIARARAAGSVLLSYSPRPVWPHADLTLSVTASQWNGVRRGHGRLRGHTMSITATGRSAARQRRVAELRVRPDVWPAA